MDKSDLGSQLIFHFSVSPYSYSGRGMFGEHCLAFTFDSEREYFAECLDIIQEPDCSYLAATFTSYKQDQSGHKSVIYFPEIPWDSSYSIYAD